MKKKKRLRKLPANIRRKLSGSHDIRYQEHFQNYMDVIDEFFSAENVSLYRWVHNPLEDDDFEPQIFQESSPLSLEQLTAPDVDTPKEVRYDYISYFCLSHFTSEKAAEEEYLKAFEKRTKNQSENRYRKIRESFIRKKGEYIQKINYTPDSALIGPDNNNHRDVLLMKDCDPKGLIDKEYKPKRIGIK